MFYRIAQRPHSRVAAARGKKNPVQIDVEVPRLFNDYCVPGSFRIFSRCI